MLWELEGLTALRFGVPIKNDMQRKKETHTMRMGTYNANGVVCLIGDFFAMYVVLSTYPT